MQNPTSFTLLSPRLQKYFQDYASFHQTRGNRFSHALGIPLIVIGLLGMLGSYPLPLDISPLPQSFFMRLDGGTLLLIFGSLAYAFMDWKITIPFGFMLSGLYFLGRALPFHINVAACTVGWILQGVGHFVFEKKSPAFLKNLTHLLIGPLWVFTKTINYR